MFRKTLKTAVGAVNKACNFLLGIVMVAMFLVLLLQIISRFISFVPLPWSQDLIVFLLVCSVFLGACTATANNKQIRLEFFVDLLPKKLTKVILIIADLISIAFLVVVTSQAFQMTGENMHVIVLWLVLLCGRCRCRWHDPQLHRPHCRPLRRSLCQKRKGGSHRMTAFLLISTGILLLIAVPIGMAMGTASLLTILQGGTLNALIITQKLLSGVSKFSLLAIPMFTLAGEVMTLGGVSDKLIYLANRVVGRFKGGLSMVTTLACMFFGAISGSATATAAAIGGIMVEPMEKAGYKKEYTAAVIASSGLLGLIIPPSGTMLMYAIVADVSVLEMFTGGIIPGIIMGVSLMAVEYFRAKRNGYGTSELDIAEFHTQSKAKIVIQSFLALLSPVIILGGIYSGKFTATEAAGVSVLYGFIIGYFVFKQLNIKKAYEACVKTGVSTSMILFLIGAAAVFGWMLTMQQIPNQIVAAISGITDSPAVVLLLINLALFVAGALLDNVAAITLLTPVLVPLVTAYGIDKTFFGIIMIINLSIGQITPPIGMNLFVSSSICEVRLEKVIRQVLPFLAVLIIDLFLFTYIPGIVTVLPNALLH